MSRVPDMGGRFGDGVTWPEAVDDPGSHEAWHALALDVTVAAGAWRERNMHIRR